MLAEMYPECSAHDHYHDVCLATPVEMTERTDLGEGIWEVVISEYE